MALRATKFSTFRKISFPARLGLSCKFTGAQCEFRPRPFYHGAPTNFRMTIQYPTPHPFKSHETAQSRTIRFRSSMPVNKNAVVATQSHGPTSPMREGVITFKEQTPNSVQQPGCGTDLMDDHVTALTRISKDALRLIIPFPHF